VADRRDRLHDAGMPSPGDRSPFELDRDRLRRSAAFQRLGQITQVMAPNGRDRFHTRRSHSLEVARIGRALAQTILSSPNGRQLAARAGGLDPAVVEAAALAHDLGHPPFGHDAEDELDHLLTAAGVSDGFEANAQSFRVVVTLALAEPDGIDAGFNLTRATLAAILKYPWRRHESPANPGKWGAYASESAELAWARALMPSGSQDPTLEAALMDWADLIAYAAQDCEDFLRVGLIPIDRLTADLAERERFLGLVTDRWHISPAEQDMLAATLQRLLTDCPLPGLSPTTRSGRAALRCFTNHQINAAISAAALVDENSSPHLAIEPQTYATILLLEGLTWHYVIDSGLLATQRHEQRRIIRELFEQLANMAISSGDLDGRPPLAQKQLWTANSDADRLRVVGDFIAAMTEDQAIAWCQQFS
jgi:dGTPase